MKIAIIGAGFSGLALATGLRRHGFDVDLYEKGDAPRGQGGFLAVYNNGFHALHRLGLWPSDGSLIDRPEAFRSHIPTTVLNVIDAYHGGTIWETVDIRDKAYGGGSLVVERSVLFDHMLAQMPGARPLCNKKVVAINQGLQGSVELTFGDGTTAQADLVIGADGGKSVVRTSLFPESTVKFQGCALVCSYHDFDPNSNDETDRALANFSAKHEFRLWLQPNSGLALMPHTETTVAAMWLIKPADIDMDSEEFLTYRDSGHIAKRLKELCSDVCELAPICLQRIRPAPLAWWPICDVDPLKTLYKGRVAVAGEAAHFMSPFGGQGTNQCFEDAVVLSDALKAAFDKAKLDPRTGVLSDLQLQDALQVYTDLRLKHVNSIQAAHRMRIPKFGWLRHKFLSWLMWLLPASIKTANYFVALHNLV